LQEIGMNVYLRDIEVPGAPFSIRTITQFIRQELGFHSTHIRGEIVRENGDLILTLRSLSSYRVPPVRIPGKDVAQLFQEGGRALLRLIAPSILVIHDTHKLIHSVDKENDYAELVPLLEYCLDFPPEKDNTLVYTLWGSALLVLNRPKEAIERYERAITLNPSYAYAYNGWGIALRNLKRPEEAIKQFEKAVSLDPTYETTYNGWGVALDNLGRHEEAIKQFQKAVSLDPTYEAVYSN
jgi:tetratricopeptide (TPR) repeat protein